MRKIDDTLTGLHTNQISKKMAIREGSKSQKKTGDFIYGRPKASLTQMDLQISRSRINISLESP